MVVTVEGKDTLVANGNSFFDTSKPLPCRQIMLGLDMSKKLFPFATRVSFPSTVTTIVL
jgi:hypothetical protein